MNDKADNDMGQIKLSNINCNLNNIHYYRSKLNLVFVYFSEKSPNANKLQSESINSHIFL